MGTIASLPTFTASQNASAADVTTAFAAIRDTVNTYGMFTDVVRTVTAVLTFSAAPVFSAGFGVAGTLTVSTGGIAVTGNSTIAGTLGSVTTLTCTTLTATTVNGTTGAFTTLSGTPNFTGVPTFGAGIGTIATATITTLTSTTMLANILKLNPDLDGLSLRGSDGGGAQVWASWAQASQSSTFGAAGTGTVTVGSSAASSVIVSGKTTTLGYTAALTQSATEGFIQVPGMANNPTGTPVGILSVPMVVDTSNLRVYFYIGATWRYAALT